MEKDSDSMLVETVQSDIFGGTCRTTGRVTLWYCGFKGCLYYRAGADLYRLLVGGGGGGGSSSLSAGADPGILKGGVWQEKKRGGGGVQPLTQVYVLQINKSSRGGGGGEGVRTPWTPLLVLPLNSVQFFQN